MSKTEGVPTDVRHRHAALRVQAAALGRGAAGRKQARPQHFACACLPACLQCVWCYTTTQGNCPRVGPGANQWCRSCTYGYFWWVVVCVCERVWVV